jgi:predicted nuclease of predicted toxin-antitoxin system
VLPPLIADENVPRGMLVRLRALRFDVLAVEDAEPRAGDRTVLAMARHGGRWLVTFDRDYGELIFKYGERPPPAILFLRQRRRAAAEFADWVHAAITTRGALERLPGHLAALDGRSVRLHPFPAFEDGRI